MINMLKKILVPVIIAILALSVVQTAFAESDDLKPYNGLVGADSPLYGIKRLFQQLDESFSLNSNDKLDKMLAHADERVSEALAMAQANNTDGFESALDGYEDLIDSINDTMENDDVGDEEYSDVGPRLDRHMWTFQNMFNNTTLNNETRYSLAKMFNVTGKIKIGRPFIYYNNTSYFIPPGHLKNGHNMTFVPPGLAKKGYKPPVNLTIINGSVVEYPPVDDDGNQSYNYSYSTNGPHGNGNGKKK